VIKSLKHVKVLVVSVYTQEIYLSLTDRMSAVQVAETTFRGHSRSSEM